MYLLTLVGDIIFNFLILYIFKTLSEGEGEDNEAGSLTCA